MTTNHQSIKIALLDLYNGQPNERIQSFTNIINQYAQRKGLTIAVTSFSVRNKNEMPDLHFDAYIASGGPGDPLESEGSVWEGKFFGLFEQLERHNATAGTVKKHSLLVCHSFQLMCRQRGLGEVNRRYQPSYGMVPVTLTKAGCKDSFLNGMRKLPYVFDSRYWQVINADDQRLAQCGAQILALEDTFANEGHPMALMAVRFNAYCVGTQFHPEADLWNMRRKLRSHSFDLKQQIVNEHGVAAYDKLRDALKNPYPDTKYLIENFLNAAIKQ